MCRHQGRIYDFRLLTAHWDETRTGSGRAESEHAHSVYHVVLFSEGNNQFQMNGRRVPSAPGVLVLTGPGEPHSFSPCRTGMTRYHEITFELVCGTDRLTIPFAELLDAYAGFRLPRPEVPMRLQPRQQRNLASLYGQLLDCTGGRGAWFEFQAGRIVLEILAFLVSNLHDEGLPFQASLEGPIQGAKDYIEAHHAESLSLRDLARRANCSTFHFCRAFKQAHGISPIAYQLQVRISAAKRLLLVSNLRCKEIADRLGFADSYCFSKAFRKLVGRSPVRWRGMQAGEDGRDRR
jgi:AraC-like DNA-binding protein